MQTSPLLELLMEEALRCLPGVGPKSAQRMAFQLLQRDRNGGMRLAQALTRSMSEIGHCADCRTFTEQDICTIRANPRRQQNGQICVMETPADIHAIKQTGQFAGRYFVLMGACHRWMVSALVTLALIGWGNGWRRNVLLKSSLPPTQRWKGRPPPTTSPRYAANMARSPAASLTACR